MARQAQRMLMASYYARRRAAIARRYRRYVRRRARTAPTLMNRLRGMVARPRRRLYRMNGRRAR